MKKRFSLLILMLTILFAWGATVSAQGLIDNTIIGSNTAEEGHFTYLEADTVTTDSFTLGSETATSFDGIDDKSEGLVSLSEIVIPFHDGSTWAEATSSADWSIR